MGDIQTGAPEVPPAMEERERPLINVDNRYFWDGVAQGLLLVQKCSDCGVLRHPSRPMCSACQSLKWEAVESCGRGHIYSFAVAHHPPTRGYTVPYVVLLVEFEEGFRLALSTNNIDVGELRIGAPVVFSSCRDGDFVYPDVCPARDSSTGTTK
jgi:uncharacterized OB-fold protein